MSLRLWACGQARCIRPKEALTWRRPSAIKQAPYACKGEFVTTPQRCRAAPAVMALVALLVGCAGPGTRVPPPPLATQAQIEKEMQVLEQSFFTDPCMDQLRQRASELKPGDPQLGIKALYAVEFAPNTQRRDGLAYRLHVRERDRTGYLYVSDGTAGSYRVFGPLPLWTCLHRALP